MFSDLKVAVEVKYFIASSTISCLQEFCYHKWKGLELVTPLPGVWSVPLLCSCKCFLVFPFGIFKVW